MTRPVSTPVALAARTIATAAALFAAAAAAAPSDFDPSFGESGVVTLAHARSSRVVQLAKANANAGMAAVVATTDAPVERWLHRLDAAGAPTATFNGGLPVPLDRAACAGTSGACAFSHIAIGHDDSVVAAGSIVAEGGRRVAVARWTASGAPDAQFGTGGALAGPSTGDWDEEVVAVAVDDDRVIWLVTVGVQRTDGAVSAVVYRFGADGAADESVGEGGRRVLNLPVLVGDAKLTSQGRLLVAGSAHSNSESMSAVLFRLTAQGEIDGSYGDSGFYFSFGYPIIGVNSLELLPDGTAMMAGFRESVVGRYGLAWWVEADGASEVFHFGSSGLGQHLTVNGARTMTVATVSDRQGGLLLVGAGEVEPFGLGGRTFAHVIVSRYAPDEQFDFTFAPGGRDTLWRHFGMVPARGAFAAAGGRIVFGGSIEHAPRPGAVWSPVSTPVVVRLKGGNLAAPVTYTTVDLVEYVHNTSGHYFLTAYPHEIAALDALEPGISEWRRSGRGLTVFDTSNWAGSGTGGNLATMCRFFSGSTFAPLFSHFYTPYSNECSTLRKPGSGWTLETQYAFYVGFLDDGPTGARGCREGRIPLYRAFNNRRSGAPNHRYTDDPAILDQMIALGWTFEGEAATRVFACLPGPLPPDVQ